MIPAFPRTISSANTFNALVDWFHDEVILGQKAPGFIVGLSGTDSLVSFCAAYKALEKIGKANRMWGVHFAPSEDFLDDHPEAEVHLWFRDQVLPWLRQQCPAAKIEVDTSIDWRCDGLRWGSLLDQSVVFSDGKRRMMRLPEDQYWVVGTRNRSEDMLVNYSNASMVASLQPLIHFWKSEVLQISEHLGIPRIAIDKSCETDCICGRQALAANHIREVDLLLMLGHGEVSHEYVENKISPELGCQLNKFINAQIASGNFKNYIPYTPDSLITSWCNDPLVRDFELGTLNLTEFNHRKHLYVAWCYSKTLNLEDAISRYSYFLQILLSTAGIPGQFNSLLTRKYFEFLDKTIREYPTDNFDELIEKSGILNVRITA